MEQKDLFEPRPLLDELALGYAGRTRKLNNIVTIDKMLEHIAQSFPFPRSPIELTALIAHQSIESLVKKHTTLPYINAFDLYLNESLQYHWASGNDLEQGKGWESLRDHAYFCKKCVLENLEKHGYAIWNRIHQLPGIFLCHQHNHPLSYTKQQNPFENTPDKCSLIFEVDKSILKISESHEAVNQYVSSAILLMKSSAPIKDIPVNHLYSSARQKSLSGRSKLELLNNDYQDLILEVFPHNWLMSLFNAEKKSEIFSLDDKKQTLDSKGYFQSRLILLLLVSIHFTNKKFLGFLNMFNQEENETGELELV